MEKLILTGYNADEIKRELAKRSEICKVGKMKVVKRRYDRFFQRTEYTYEILFEPKKPEGICQICKRGIYNVPAIINTKIVCSPCYYRIQRQNKTSDLLQSEV